MSAGQLDVVVSSFTQDAEDLPETTPPFHFIGTTSTTSFESLAPSSSWLGSGSLETDYNYTQYFGPLYIDGFSASFSVAHGSVSNVLSDASVSITTTVESGTHGGYSGRLDSDRLSGTFSFESISPYDWVPWHGEPSPTRGELLITAEDGSTLQIVVIDELSIRLDLDYEGDSIVDEEIATTWAELL